MLDLSWVWSGQTSVLEITADITSAFHFLAK